MKIGLDIDGVIGNFMSLLLVKLKNLGYGVSLESYDRRYEEWAKQVGMPRRDFIKMIAKILKSINIFETRLVDDGIPSYFSQLKKEGNEIFIVSHREKNSYQETAKWLKNKNIPYDGLFLVNDKKNTLKNLNLDVYVDDDPLELFYGNRTPVARHIFLFNWPYNSDVREIKRVSSWDELYKEISNIKNAKRE